MLARVMTAAVAIATTTGALWAAEGGYAIVVSKTTASDSAWQNVVATVVEKHGARVIQYETSVTEALDSLKRMFPRFTCFVARPDEAGREFVAAVHRLTRAYDDDPYTDTFWGILTGFDAANAIEIAKHAEPLVVRKVAAGTEVALEMCEEGLWYCELTQGRMVRKEKGQAPRELKGPADTTKALVDSLNEYGADLFITSGHATERDWQIGYRYKNGSFRSGAGKMMGVDTAGKNWPVNSNNPKVYLAVGNCLMGHIDGADAMALAWMKSAGVRQMAGYTVPSWYGYAGWGCLDYFVEQPGRYTLTQAFVANDHALVNRIATFFPELLSLESKAGQMPTARAAIGDAAKKAGLNANDARGLLYDRDVLAFYGDPAWEARMADNPKGWDQQLTVNNGEYVLELRAKSGGKSFDTVNKNGSQRGGRPIIQFLPHRIHDVEILQGKDLGAVISDDFVLLPRPNAPDPSGIYRLRFRARVMD